ncbi:MAG: hypothetical protein LBL73_03195 [Synergistaceae bacterium]|nr:hypothetical protein [Synergistaceae bacterium]
MGKKFSLLFVSLLILVITGGPSDALDGFRGFLWGQSLSSTGYMKYVGELDGLRYYVKMNDRLSMGGAALDEIKYAFESGRLAGVVISSMGSRNAWLILESLKETYGTPSKRDANNLYWPIGKGGLFYRFSPHSQRLFVSFLSELATERSSLGGHW